MVRFLSVALLASACANTAHAVYRGVNLGGWLVLEPWYVPLRIRRWMGIVRMSGEDGTLMAILAG